MKHPNLGKVLPRDDGIVPPLNQEQEVDAVGDLSFSFDNKLDDLAHGAFALVYTIAI